MKILAVLALAGFANLALAAPARCLGPKDAQTRVIYLHGMDDESVSAQEQENRRILQNLAEALKLRVAVVRGNHRCQGKVCWNHATPDDVKTTYAHLRKEAEECFAGKEPFGLLGFSNGGYLAGKIVYQCLEPLPTWAVVVGSAGSLKPARDLAACAPITVLIGERDLTRDKARRFEKELARHGALSRFETFAGGHEFKEPVLKQILKAPVPQRKSKP